MSATAPAPATRSTSEVLLEVEDLHVHLGESHILHGVGFEVAAGSVTALLGRNGVGKTTTLRGILGLVSRTGVVRFDGIDLTSLATHEIIQLGLAYVPEDREVFAGLTVAENLRLAEQAGMDHRYDLVYELFPRLKERRGQFAGTLSGGEQQMLSLGRVLLNESRLLLVDEPTKGLAPNLVAEVADALQRLSQLATILVVEQNLPVVRRMASAAVVIDHGEVVHRGDATALLDDAALTQQLLGVSGARRDRP